MCLLAWSLAVTGVCSLLQIQIEIYQGCWPAGQWKTPLMGKCTGSGFISVTLHTEFSKNHFCRVRFLSFLMFLTCFCSIACHMAPPRYLLRGSLQAYWQILKASAEKTKDREGRIKKKETQLNVFDIHWHYWTYQRFTPYFWAVFHGVDVPQVVAPFIGQRTPGLFPVLGSYK